MPATGAVAPFLIHTHRMPSCIKKIKRNVRANCDKPLAQGVGEQIYAFMKDSQSVALTMDTVLSTSLATAIALGPSEKLIVYEGVNLSNDPSVGFNRTDFGVTLPHSLVLMLFSNSPETKEEIHAMLTRRDLGFIYKRQAGDWEITGYGTGMRMSGFTYKANDANKGAYVVTFEAPDETRLPITLRHTSAGGLDDTSTYLAGMALADA